MTAPVQRRQFEMAAQEIGVDMGLDHTLDRQPRLGRLIEVDADISAGIDDDRTTGRLVANEIRGVRQTGQIVLRENHRSRPRDRSTYSPQGSPPARFGTQLTVRLILANWPVDVGLFG